MARANCPHLSARLRGESSSGFEDALAAAAVGTKDKAKPPNSDLNSARTAKEEAESPNPDLKTSVNFQS